MTAAAAAAPLGGVVAVIPVEPSIISSPWWRPPPPQPESATKMANRAPTAAIRRNRPIGMDRLRLCGADSFTAPVACEGAGRRAEPPHRRRHRTRSARRASLASRANPDHRGHGAVGVECPDLDGGFVRVHDDGRLEPCVLATDRIGVSVPMSSPASTSKRAMPSCRSSSPRFALTAPSRAATGACNAWRPASATLATAQTGHPHTHNSGHMSVRRRDVGFRFAWRRGHIVSFVNASPYSPALSPCRVGGHAHRRLSRARALWSTHSPSWALDDGLLLGAAAVIVLALFLTRGRSHA